MRETRDISQESVFTKPIVRLARAKTEQNMTATLERTEQEVSPGLDPPLSQGEAVVALGSHRLGSWWR